MLVYDFLTIHVVTLLEFEQVIKEFLDLEIFRCSNYLIKQRENLRKHRRERERDKENEKRITCRYRLLVVTVVYIFCLKKKCREKQYHSAVSTKVI